MFFTCLAKESTQMNEMTNFVGNTDLKVGVRLNQKHLKRRVALRKIHAHILSQLEG